MFDLVDYNHIIFNVTSQKMSGEKNRVVYCQNGRIELTVQSCDFRNLFLGTTFVPLYLFCVFTIH